MFSEIIHIMMTRKAGIDGKIHHVYMNVQRISGILWLSDAWHEG